MLSKPNGWNFTERGIMAQLEVGRHALASAMQELIDAGYVRRTSFMAENLRRWVTEVYDVPCFGFPSIESPEHRETEALSNEPLEVTNERSNKAKPPKGSTSMKGDWQPEPANWQAIIQRHPNLDCQTELDNFRDHWIGKGERRADWNASLRTWMRNAEKWQRVNPADRPKNKPANVGPNGRTFCDTCHAAWAEHDTLYCDLRSHR
jgi:hypothetical protein